MPVQLDGTLNRKAFSIPCCGPPSLSTGRSSTLEPPPPKRQCPDRAEPAAGLLETSMQQGRASVALQRLQQAPVTRRLGRRFAAAPGVKIGGPSPAAAARAAAAAAQWEPAAQQQKQAGVPHTSPGGPIEGPAAAQEQPPVRATPAVPMADGPIAAHALPALSRPAESPAVPVWLPVAFPAALARAPQLPAHVPAAIAVVPWPRPLPALHQWRPWLTPLPQQQEP